MLNLNSSLPMWELTTQEYEDHSYLMPASRAFSVVNDERAGHEYEYYIIGGVLPGIQIGSEIYKIKLQNNKPKWENMRDLSPNMAASYNSSAAFYNSNIYYFVGYSTEISGNLSGRNNVLYKINPDNFGVEQLSFIGNQVEKRSDLELFVHGNNLYVINGYIAAWGVDRNSSNVWCTDLSQTTNRKWIKVYDRKDFYDSNANTIRIAPITSYDSSYGENQCPFIKIDYEYDTKYKVVGTKISPIINKDSYIAKESPTTNFGTNNYVVSKEADEESGVEDRALFGLNLSSLPSSIDVLSAILYIPRASNSSQNGNQAKMEIIKEDWDEDNVNWFERKDGVSWGTTGGGFQNNWSSYNLKIDSYKNQYDITRILQQITGSFSVSSISNFGVAIYNQDTIFDSKELSNNSYLYISYIDKTEKELGKVTLNTPNSGSRLTSTPTFKFKVPYAENNERLHFRLELSQDISFSEDNITSFLTSNSITGWSWDSDGDDAGYVAFPTIGISGYTSDTSLVKFDMSATSSSLGSGTWFWRVFAIFQ